MQEKPLELIRLVDNIEKHYLLKKNRRGRACFSSSVEAVIKASEEKVSKKDLILLKGQKWKYEREFSKWFLSTKDIKLESIGVII